MLADDLKKMNVCQHHAATAKLQQSRAQVHVGMSMPSKTDGTGLALQPAAAAGALAGWPHLLGKVPEHILLDLPGGGLWQLGTDPDPNPSFLSLTNAHGVSPQNSSGLAIIHYAI